PQSCTALCSIGSTGTAFDSDWLLYAQVLTRWTFRDRQGASFFVNDLDAGTGVSVRWSGSWRVAIPAGIAGDLCNTATDRLMSTLNDVPGYAVGAGGAAHLADGCLISVQHDVGEGTPEPSDAALVLSRFGTLIAADPAAQSLFPSLPVASAHERALAQH